MKIKTVSGIRFVAGFMVAVMLSLLSFSYIGQGSSVEAKTVDQMQQEIDKLEKEQKDIASKISSTKTNQKKEKEKQALLSSQIKSTEDQLEIYGQKIDVVTDEIKLKEEEITTKLGDIDKNEELFAQRVRAMYIANTSSTTLSTLLSAKSFSQFLNNSEILKRISESDKDLIEELSRQQSDLEEAKKLLEERQADLKATKSAEEAKRTNLASLYQQSTSSEAQLKLAEKKYMEEKSKNAKEIAKIEAAVADAIAAAGNNGAGPQGKLAWPVPASSRVTSAFGWRTIWGKKEFHLGIDIGAKAGTAINAAEDGQVILVRKSSTGYGWHVVINHGGGYATLYAHTSRIDVTEGQQVKRGQTIAGVGTTGASTGNHLHFEVRINSKQVDPMGYVVKP